LPTRVGFPAGFLALHNRQVITMKNDFYTYAYLREDGTPYYIGKGRGRRAFREERRIIKTPPKERILLLKTGLTEEQAFRHEIYMIAVYGRKDIGTGILCNFTDGGEGSSGVVVSEETRLKRREANYKQAREGRHPSQQPAVKQALGERSRLRNKKLSQDGKHPFQSQESRDKQRRAIALLNEKLLKEGKHPFQSIENRKATAERVSKKFRGAKRWVNREGERKFQHEKPEGEWQNGIKWMEGR
jgi:hypothetical protein